MSRPEIRSARTEDLPALLRMVHALAVHHGDVSATTLEDLRRDIFGGQPWLHVLVAESGGALMGYAALLPLARLQFGQRGMELHHLYVAPDDRDSGTGSRLIEASVSHARRLGCSYIAVGTHPENAAAAAFYRRRGFLPQDVGARFTRRLAA